MSDDSPKPEKNMRQKLRMAACMLVAASSHANAQSAVNEWEVDTSYLSYTESDARVSVSKSLANLVRRTDSSSINVNLVHDTMSGASPTGAIRSQDSAVTFTSASGGSFNATGGGDYSKSEFEDTRIQAGLTYQHEPKRRIKMSYGALVSQESDYDSFGANIEFALDNEKRLSTYTLGLAFTGDTIYRSDTDGTPEPLANVENGRPFTAGKRTTLDTLLGFSRILNEQTVAQFNVTFGRSSGYHSDPYKIISAADSEDRILANFHDSRPESRTRTAFFSRLIHKLKGSDNSINLSYRLYMDDWGIVSHTADARYRFQISKKHFLEPHLRLYRQSQADFYYRKLNVDADTNPVLPDDGLASADYRLDSITSSTIGLKYGVNIAPGKQFRLRAEYLNQWFATADYKELGALILQASFRFGFK